MQKNKEATIIFGGQCIKFPLECEVALRIRYLVVSTDNVCTDGTQKCSDVIHKAVWEPLTPGNIQF